MRQTKVQGTTHATALTLPLLSLLAALNDDHKLDHADRLLHEAGRVLEAEVARVAVEAQQNVAAPDDRRERPAGWTSWSSTPSSLPSLRSASRTPSFMSRCALLMRMPFTVSFSNRLTSGETGVPFAFGGGLIDDDDGGGDGVLRGRALSSPNAGIKLAALLGRMEQQPSMRALNGFMVFFLLWAMARG